jgi:TrmH family RNA methyltransferase
MANMGLQRLVLAVSPLKDIDGALQLARDGEDIVRRSRYFPALAEAIAPYGLVAGTTRRKGRFRRSVLSFDQAIERIVRAAARNPVAILFGREDYGLSNEELALCQFSFAIPAAPPASSLNVAQAVMVVAHELRRHRADGRPSALSLVRQDDLRFLYRRLKRLIGTVGYEKSGDRDIPSSVLKMFQRVFSRSGLTRDECNGLHGVCRQVERAVERRKAHSA